jgi:hypothetical protein
MSGKTVLALCSLLLGMGAIGICPVPDKWVGIVLMAILAMALFVNEIVCAIRGTEP